MYLQITTINVDWDNPRIVFGFCRYITVSVLPSSLLGTTIFCMGIRKTSITNNVSMDNVYSISTDISENLWSGQWGLIMHMDLYCYACY